MSDAQNEEKLTAWKNKFFELSESFEKQQKYDQLLERSLSRLALAAQGVDPVLDKHLVTVRSLLRKSSHDTVSLEKVLEKVELAIGQMDEKQSSATSPAEQISTMIAQISWPKPYRKASQKLLKKTRSASKDDLPDIIAELTTLLDQCFSSNSELQNPGFLSKIFGTKTHIDAEQTESEVIVDIDEAATTTHEPHKWLIDLLERLSLPPQLSKQATKIRLRIEHGIDEIDLPATINEIAALVGDLGSSAAKEKKEHERFLKDLTHKITTLDQHLRQIGQDDVTAFEQRRELSDDVGHEMQGLRSELAGAADLSQLKQTLSKRIEYLNQHINSYHRADIERFNQSQQQINGLNQRLQEMEAETASLRETARKAQDMAMKDVLTGVWNRQALTEALEREFHRWERYRTPLTMVIWDIDHFKSVNDRYGHSAGDVVLKTIAQIFSKMTRKSDFIARFGGEEFVGLFPETNLEDSLLMANKIRQAIEKKHFLYKENTVPITASAGLATFEDGDTIDKVFNRADKALYAAKNNGRNNCQI
jgi:diguanylate cyclase